MASPRSISCRSTTEPSTPMSSKRKSSQVEAQKSATGHKSRRVDEPATPQRMQNQDFVGETGSMSPSQREPLARFDILPLTSNRQPQNQKDASMVVQKPPTVSHPLSSLAAITTASTRIAPSVTTYEVFYRFLENFPLNAWDLHSFPTFHRKEMQAFISTFRPTPFHFRLYKNWIYHALNAIWYPGPLKKDPFTLFSWQRLDERDPSGSFPIPVTTLPPKVELPQLQIGHLFLSTIFGNECDVPLYYIQVVCGLSDAFKVVVCCSKREVVSSMVYEASCGYSTVFICAICQNTRSRFLTPEEIFATTVHSRGSVEQAQELWRKDKKYKFIY